MAYLQWQDNFSVGVETLDADHKKLIDLINLIYEAMAGDRQATVVAEVLDELIHYTNFHFGREENLMRASGYPDVDKHSGIHKEMINQVKEMKARFNADPRNVSAMETFDFLSRWLIRHIVGEDMKYTPYMSA